MFRVDFAVNLNGGRGRRIIRLCLHPPTHRQQKVHDAGQDGAILAERVIGRRRWLVTVHLNESM